MVGSPSFLPNVTSPPPCVWFPLLVGDPLRRFRPPLSSVVLPPPPFQVRTRITVSKLDLKALPVFLVSLQLFFFTWGPGSQLTPLFPGSDPLAGPSMGLVAFHCSHGPTLIFPRFCTFDGPHVPVSFLISLWPVSPGQLSFFSSAQRFFP